MDGLCDPGYYCEAGSSGPEEAPCPAGTYNGESGKQAEHEWAICSARMKISVAHALCARALRKVGAEVTVTADPDVLRSADRIVLPACECIAASVHPWGVLCLRLRCR